MSMRRYEVVFVLAPQLTEDEVKGQTETFQNVAEEKGAKVLNVDDWGKRRLAFPVKKNKEGVYVILTLEEESADAVSELERRFRVSDNVIRYLTVRIDEDLKRAEKFAVRRNRRRDQPAEEAQKTEAVPTEKESAQESAEGVAEQEPPTEEAVAETAEEAAPEEATADEAEAATPDGDSGEESPAEEASQEAGAEEEKPEDAKAVEEK